MIIVVQASSAQRYFNPILSGFYPDPSICRVGNDYYIVNSSFAYFPGLPIFHSTDLASWKLLGHAMDRKEQLDLTNAGVSRGLFAPTIRYKDGTFYILCTLIDKGGNFIITAKDPKGPWSNPIWIKEVQGIDPSLDFVDDKAYITYNSVAPDDKALYDGHRTIRSYEFNLSTMKVVGKERLLVNGGTDLSKKPIWIEGPHLFKKNGWYYLLCAEGGTGYNHAAVIFRSKTVEGPFVSFDKNPILTQRHLDPARANAVTTTGHADFVETPDGRWYAVFLGCRPYEGDYYNTGRETFMLPVQWENDWPIMLKGTEQVLHRYPLPFPQGTSIKNEFNGNVKFHDDFKADKLSQRYIFLRNPDSSHYRIKRNKLNLRLQGATLEGKQSPTFVGFRQHNMTGEASAKLSFSAASELEKSGITIFQSEHHYYFLCKSVTAGKPVVQLFRGAGNTNEKAAPILMAEQPLPTRDVVYLKIKAEADKYSFFYSTKKNNWQLLLANVDGKFLSTKVAGGFVGSLFALHGTSNGAFSQNVAVFDWFEYSGDDAVYKRHQ